MRFASLLASFVVVPLAAQKAAPTVPPVAPVPVAGKPMPEDPARYAAAAAAWFPVMDQSVEASLGDKEVKGVFRFKNPRDHAVEWRHLTGSCTCSMAAFVLGERRFELRSKTKQLVRVTGPGPDQFQVVDAIPIGPGEEGVVEIHVETLNAKTNKAVSVDIHSTDPAVPMARLQVRVSVQQAITVSPADITLGVVGDGESREFTAQVTSLKKEFVIRGASPFPKGVTATWERHEKNGMPWYEVKGTFRQDSVGDANAVLEFQTNLVEAPTFHVRLHASVRSAVEVKPTFFAVGKVKRGSTGSAKVTFTASDGRELNAVALRCENLNVPAKFVTARSSHDGKNLVVELEVAADAPLGLVKGDLVIDLDHPVVKQRRLLFNAFVR